MNNNYESHAISRRSFLKASGVVGAAGILDDNIYTSLQ